MLDVFCQKKKRELFWVGWPRFWTKLFVNLLITDGEELFHVPLNDGPVMDPPPPSDRRCTQGSGRTAHLPGLKAVDHLHANVVGHWDIMPDA